MVFPFFTFANLIVLYPNYSLTLLVLCKCRQCWRQIITKAKAIGNNANQPENKKINEDKKAAMIAKSLCDFAWKIFADAHMPRM